MFVRTKFNAIASFWRCRSAYDTQKHMCACISSVHLIQTEWGVWMISENVWDVYNLLIASSMKRSQLEPSLQPHSQQPSITHTHTHTYRTKCAHHYQWIRVWTCSGRQWQSAWWCLVWLYAHRKICVCVCVCAYQLWCQSSALGLGSGSDQTFRLL